MDGGANWNSGNSDLQITGFQSMSWSPLTARVIGGTQDNGTEMWLGTRVWDHRDDGDSASTVLDRDDVLTMLDLYVCVDPRKSTSGGGLGTWGSIVNGLMLNATGNPCQWGDPSALYAPIVEDPSAPHPLYFGTNRLYMAADKTNWTAVSPVLGGNAFFAEINTTNVITAIAVAPSNNNRIYVGYYDGEIFRTKNNACNTNGCWNSIGGAAKGLPTSPVTRIAVDPGNADIVYATFSGFSSGAHVFKSANGGSSWTAVSSRLPSIPANTITIETSSILWVGMDDGVYRSGDGGNTWTRYGSLPHVPVYEIALDPARGRLFAGTWTRHFHFDAAVSQ